MKQNVFQSLDSVVVTADVQGMTALIGVTEGPMRSTFE